MNRGMQGLALVLVVVMFAAAGWAEEKALIFPEIAALACGAWVMEKPPWRFTPLTVWLSPTVAAAMGVALLRYLPLSTPYVVCTAFTLVALQLKLTRSAVVPSLSAAILPIVTDVDSLSYPLSVCLFSGAIALVHAVRCRVGARTMPPAFEQEGPSPPLRSEIARWGKLALGVLAAALIALRSNAPFVVAPPLIVTFVELSRPESPLRQRLGRVVALLALAALAGTLQVHLIHTLLHWPLWGSAAISLATVFILYHLFRLPFPPASAIALLPTIIPAEYLWLYPWQVLIGAITFTALSVLLFKGAEGIGTEGVA